MKKERKGMFETNSSSSVHAICIDTTPVVKKIKRPLLITVGTYGWEWNALKTPDDRVSYIYSYIWEYHWTKENKEKFHAYKKQFTDILDHFGITYVIIDDDESSGWGIDHTEKLPPLEKFLQDDVLIPFIFNPDSEVITGNDNDDSIDDVEKAEAGFKKDHPNGITYIKYN